MFQKWFTKKEPLKEIHFKALHRLYCDPADFNQILSSFIFYSFRIIGESFMKCKLFLAIPIFPRYNLPKITKQGDFYDYIWISFCTDRKNVR